MAPLCTAYIAYPILSRLHLYVLDKRSVRHGSNESRCFVPLLAHLPALGLINNRILPHRKRIPPDPSEVPVELAGLGGVCMLHNTVLTWVLPWDGASP